MLPRRRHASKLARRSPLPFTTGPFPSSARLLHPACISREGGGGGGPEQAESPSPARQLAAAARRILGGASAAAAAVSLVLAPASAAGADLSRLIPPQFPTQIASTATVGIGGPAEASSPRRTFVQIRIPAVSDPEIRTAQRSLVSDWVFPSVHVVRYMRTVIGECSRA